jgi:hypothetical protein
VLGGLVALLALGAVVAGVILLTSGKNRSSASHSSASASLASHRTSSVPPVQPSTVTVSVLNGTDQLGLAGSVSQRLAAVGYRKGAVTNAADQTHTTSIVAYLAPKDRRDAFAVASALKLSSSVVEPIDSATQKIACSASPLGCASPVFVTVGTDLVTP